MDGVAGSPDLPDASAPDGGAETATVARDDLYEVDALRPTTVAAPGLLANDTLGDAELVPASSTTRLGGSVVLSADGSFDYTPPADPGSLPRLDDFSYVLQTDQGEVAASVGLALVSQPIASDDELGVLHTGRLEQQRLVRSRTTSPTAPESLHSTRPPPRAASCCWSRRVP